MPTLLDRGLELTNQAPESVRISSYQVEDALRGGADGVDRLVPSRGRHERVGAIAGFYTQDLAVLVPGDGKVAGQGDELPRAVQAGPHGRRSPGRRRI